jgi:anthranilate phosphoribosyltransferase
MIQQAIEQLVKGQNLQRHMIDAIIDEIATGKATQTQVAALLMCMKMKGETPEEIASLAVSLRRYSISIYPNVNGRLVDNCGTGGDRIKTFNISTLSAFVAAGAGVMVAKHGNRSATSRFGSADLLESLGLNLNIKPSQVKECIERIGIGFIFAPVFHPALRQVSQTRKELGVRTVFNIMGPLLNPAPIDAQVLGVCDPTLVRSMAGVVSLLGIKEAMIVHATEGMDEISLSCRNVIAWLKDGKVSIREYTPRDFHLPRYSTDELVVQNGEECKEVAIKLLTGDIKKGAKYDTLLVNAAAAIIVSGLADNFGEAIDMAKASLDSGRAYTKMKELIALSKDISSKEGYQLA